MVKNRQDSLTAIIKILNLQNKFYMTDYILRVIRHIEMKTVMFGL